MLSVVATVSRSTCSSHVSPFVRQENLIKEVVDSVYLHRVVSVIVC